MFCWSINVNFEIKTLQFYECTINFEIKDYPTYPDVYIGSHNLKVAIQIAVNFVQGELKHYSDT